MYYLLEDKIVKIIEIYGVSYYHPDKIMGHIDGPGMYNDGFMLMDSSLIFKSFEDAETYLKENIANSIIASKMMTFNNICLVINDILNTEKYKYIVVNRSSYILEDCIIYPFKASSCRLHFEPNINEFKFITYYTDSLPYDYPHQDICTVFTVQNNEFLWNNPLFETLNEAENYKSLKDKEKLIKNVIE